MLDMNGQRQPSLVGEAGLGCHPIFGRELHDATVHSWIRVLVFHVQPNAGGTLWFLAGRAQLIPESICMQRSYLLAHLGRVRTKVSTINFRAWPEVPLHHNMHQVAASLFTKSWVGIITQIDCAVEHSFAHQDGNRPLWWLKP
jgi:hypothetical protein